MSITYGCKQVIDKKILDRVEARIADLSPPVAMDLPTKQNVFLQTAMEYAKRLGLTDPDPKIVFLDRSDPVHVIWNPGEHRQEVNNRYIDAPGLAWYTAVMGRFMTKNFDRCVGSGKIAAVSGTLWNEFRMSMVDYVIVTEPDATDLRNSPLFSQSTRIFRTLKKMEASPGVGTGPVRKIALGLLDRFDCNWTSESIVDNVLAINREQSLMPEQVVRDAFAAEP